MTQPELNFNPAAPVSASPRQVGATSAPPAGVGQAFDEWVHSQEGGMVANWFIRLAVRAKKAGLEHYGAKGIAEVLRWKFALRKMDGEVYKINNNYISRLSRFAETKCPELRGMFEKRRLAE